MSLNKEFQTTRLHVKHGDLYACFSLLINGLISDFMDIDAYEAWRKDDLCEYNKNRKNKLPDTPMLEEDIISIQDAVLRMRTDHTGYWTEKLLCECGISQTEAHTLVQAVMTTNHPFLKNGAYFCPKCKRAQSAKDMAECEFCGWPFAW